MTTRTALNIVQDYYQCFNNKDWNGMLALVDDSIRHEPNEGEVRIGKMLFKEFLHKMDTSYEEKLTDLVFFTEPSGTRIAAEFTVNIIVTVVLAPDNNTGIALVSVAVPFPLSVHKASDNVKPVGM